VILQSTYKSHHSAEVHNSGEEKPSMILEYNRHKGGVYAFDVYVKADVSSMAYARVFLDVGRSGIERLSAIFFEEPWFES